MARGGRGGRARDRRRDAAQRTAPARLEARGHRDGRMFGSVSGGCVEADVGERAKTVLDGEPAELVTYGIADDEAWSVGLPCGGEIDVFVEPFAGAPPIERGTSYVVVAGDEASASAGTTTRSTRTDAA